MKQKTTFYCKGCNTEVIIFGKLSKDAQVYCDCCKVEMDERLYHKWKKCFENGFKTQKKGIQEKNND